MPVQPMMVWKGLNCEDSSASVAVMMSLAMVDMPREVRTSILPRLMGLMLLSVEGQSRTVMEFFWLLGWRARAERTAEPSSPAPRTRMDVMTMEG